MDTKSKYEYEAYIKERVISRSMLETAKIEGIEEGIEKGIEKGVEKGVEKEKILVALELHKEGLGFDFISRVTKLSEEAIIKILKDNGLLL